ncbi:hypothetical protein DFQ30_006180 [Apophysomyces sp. BC1015]|nr:hypothetical protein DFQ30_006180 [Apophysomyces sp. BC1015]
MTEAWKTALPTSRKIVLLALCDNANDQGECYPSIPMIAGKCSLKERVVYECLRDLETGGYLKRDTRSGRSTIYRIANPCIWRTPAFNASLRHMQGTPAPDAPLPLHHMQGTPAPDAPPPLHHMQGTPAPDAPLPLHHMQGTPAPDAPPPLHHMQAPPAPDAPPPLHHMQDTPAPDAPITINEPSIEPSLNHQGDGSMATRAKKSGRESAPSAVALPDWLPAASWEALIEHRKATKSAMTPQAQKLAISKLDELRSQGNDPAAVINQTILNGWKGLFPLQDNQRQQPQQAQRRNIHDERAATIAALTGRDRAPASGRIIDITPAAADIVD